MYRTRNNYWSCSKFADWLRSKVDVVKPSAASLEEWDEWKATYKNTHTFFYWLTEHFLDDVQDVLFYLPDVYNEFRYYCRNRFFDKLHYLPTKLKPGEYNEVQTRILHGLFETLVDFIEIEKAWMQVVFSKEEREKFKYPWWTKKHWTNWYRWRCPEAGIAHLEWEITLGNDPSDMENYVPHQAAAAKEQLELYKWWKEVRPLRPEPMDASGWSEICAREENTGLSILRNIKNRTEEEEKEVRTALDLTNEIEERYHKEDEEMLIRLIKIRDSLWT